MSYENSLQCRLLATHCCSCGRPLVDAVSVELGIGPECRSGFDGGITPSQREACNVLTHRASVLATEGNVEGVRAVAEEVRALGLLGLADKIASRFVNAERQAKITIRTVTITGTDYLAVDTPYKRSAGTEFVGAWRSIPGRLWRDGRNLVPVSSKPQLWALLKQFFPGEFGKGDRGVFRVPGQKPRKRKVEVAQTA
jgi:hypothetical protein